MCPDPFFFELLQNFLPYSFFLATTEEFHSKKKKLSKFPTLVRVGTILQNVQYLHLVRLVTARSTQAVLLFFKQLGGVVGSCPCTTSTYFHSLAPRVTPPASFQAELRQPP